MGYLTPNAIPTGTTCRVLLIPDNQEFLANVTGALEELTFPENWFPQGALTPEQSAAAMVPMFDAFCFRQGVCRVIGEIIPFAGSSSPDAAWLPCDGRSLARSDYPDLFTTIGITYGSVDGSHFNIPDMRDRTIVGVGSVHSIGDSFGEETHTLTSSEMPSHIHTDLGHSHSYVPAIASLTIPGELPIPVATAIPGVSVTGIGNANIQATGGSGAHNNVQPSICLTYLIVAL